MQTLAYLLKSTRIFLKMTCVFLEIGWCISLNRLGFYDSHSYQTMEEFKLLPGKLEVIREMRENGVALIKLQNALKQLEAQEEILLQAMLGERGVVYNTHGAELERFLERVEEEKQLLTAYLDEHMHSQEHEDRAFAEALSAEWLMERQQELANRTYAPAATTTSTTSSAKVAAAKSVASMHPTPRIEQLSMAHGENGGSHLFISDAPLNVYKDALKKQHLNRLRLFEHCPERLACVKQMASYYRANADTEVDTAVLNMNLESLKGIVLGRRKSKTLEERCAALIGVMELHSLSNANGVQWIAQCILDDAKEQDALTDLAYELCLVYTTSLGPLKAIMTKIQNNPLFASQHCDLKRKYGILSDYYHYKRDRFPPGLLLLYAGTMHKYLHYNCNRTKPFNDAKYITAYLEANMSRLQ